MHRRTWLKSLEVVLLALVSYPALAASNAANVEVGQARIFLPQSGAKATGSKMTVYNRSDKELIIYRVESDAFNKIMLHQSEFKGGKRVMEPVKQIRIAAHQRLAMTPNTVHVMFMDFVKPLKNGDLISFTLITNQGNVPVIARIAPMHLR